MKVSNNNRKKYHEDKKYVDYSGNKWALEGKLNRLASDKWPSEKLRLLEKETGTGDVPNRWPAKDQEFMTRKERFDLISAERYFRFSIRTRASNERDNYVNLGMSKFKEFVDARRLRLYREVLKSFEHLPRFAGINPDANVAQIPDIESLSIFSYGPWLPSHRSD